jgi:hypothetical protein
VKRLRIISVVVALGAAALAPAAQATGATVEGAAAPCSASVGSVTAAGAHTATVVTAGTPPTAGTTYSTPNVFKPGQVRLSSTFESEPNVAGSDSSGYVVQGDGLYARYYNFNLGSDITTRIGGGWTNFSALEVAHFEQGKLWHWNAYGLRSDGTLFRWNVTGKGWRSAGSATGFAAVKSMALIAKTPTYDTFLANTRGGALYTIRIPVASTMKPVVKQVRAKTWQGFEALVASKCGNYGTLLIGIDRDTKSAYAYAVGHTNGTATVINGLGKVDGTFPDAVQFRWGPVFYYDPLNGD